MNYWRTLLATGILLASSFHNFAQDDLNLVKEGLQTAFAKFSTLQEEGHINYNVPIDEQRYAKRVDQVAQALEMIIAQSTEYSKVHSLSSEALIGIRGLRTSGSIGIIKKESREIYIVGFKSLTQSVKGLYELKGESRDSIIEESDVEVSRGPGNGDATWRAMRKIRSAQRGLRSMVMHDELEFASMEARHHFRSNIRELRRALDILEWGEGQHAKRRAARIVRRSISNFRGMLFTGELQFTNPLSLFQWRRNMEELQDAREILTR